MEEQSKFLEMLENMKNIARTQGNQLTREEMEQYLDGLELSEEQWRAVCQYLGAYQIRVPGYEYVPDHSKIQKHYRRDLQNLPAGCQDVPVQEIRSFLEGDLQYRERIIEGRLCQVVEIAEQYTRYSVPLEELIAEGNLGLLHGMAKAESDRDRLVLPGGAVDIQAFCKILEQEVINAIEQLINQEAESRGQETAMLAKTNLLHESAKYLTEENGKIPTVQELSDYTRVPAEEIRQIMGLSEDAKRVAQESV